MSNEKSMKMGKIKLPSGKFIRIQRRCGVRVVGGIYMVTPATVKELTDYSDISDTNIEGKLILFPKPYPTLVPLHPFRGFRAFDTDRFFRDMAKLRRQPPEMSEKEWLEKLRNQRPRLKNCYYARSEVSRSWLHWIGNKFYSIPEFISEAKRVGVSRRVPSKVLKSMVWKDKIFLASKQPKLKNPVVFGYFTLDKIEGIKVDIDAMPQPLRDATRYMEVDE